MRIVELDGTCWGAVVIGSSRSDRRRKRIVNFGRHREEQVQGRRISSVCRGQGSERTDCWYLLMLDVSSRMCCARVKSRARILFLELGLVFCVTCGNGFLLQ
jgi:hypothetical protein